MPLFSHSSPNLLRAYFPILAAAIIISIFVITWWLADLSAKSLRQQIEDNNQKDAEKILSFVDKEIVSTRNVLVALASSPYLQTRDIEAFYRQALQVARQLKMQIVLRDIRLDQQLMNTALPWGEKLLRAPPYARSEAQDAALRSGQPATTGVFWAPLVSRYLIAVLVPVRVHGQPEFILTVGVPVDRFSEIINQAREVGREQLVTIWDQQRIIVARSEKQTEFAGKPLTSLPDQSYPGSGEGIVRGTSLEGIAYSWANVRSKLTGWTISSGIPESQLQAASQLTLMRFAAVGGAVVLIGVLAAHLIGNRLSQSFGALSIDRNPTREEFRLLFESAPNGVLVIDRAGHIVLLNAQMEKMFGYRREQLIGSPVEMLIPERLRDVHAALREGFASAPAARAMGAGRDLFACRRDGSEFPVEIGLNPINTRAGNLVMATVVDITKRKQTMERLSAALAERDEARRRFMQAQEEERLRLAHELHDETGQSLAAAMLELRAIENLVDAGGRDRVRLLRHQLEAMGKILHQVSWDLRPAAINELGLSTAVAEQLAQWSAKFGIETDLHCADCNLDALPAEITATIYRIVQESLTNVAKHAPNARSVSVVVELIGDTLRLVIEDDGCGFDVAALSGANSDGLGLIGMRERLSSVGGALEIESSSGGGTTIYASIPLTAERLSA
jgi:PAS domain S-box-containing protein